MNLRAPWYTPLLLLWLSACGPRLPEAAPIAAAADPAQTLAELARASGGPWQVRFDPTWGTAAFLQGRTAPLATQERLASASRLFLLRFRGLFGLAAEEGDLVHVATDHDALQMRHVRFVQAHDMVPIHGASVTVHLDAQGGVARVHGHTVPAAQLEIDQTDPRSPPTGKEAARQRALDATQEALPAAALSAAVPVLRYLPDPAQRRLHLAYRVEVSGQLGALPVFREIFIAAAADAALLRDTDLVAHLSLRVPTSGSGIGALGEQRALNLIQRDQTFYLEDQTRGGRTTKSVRALERLPGRTLSSSAPDRWDEGRAGAGLAVDVHAHLSTIWDYFARNHGRYGWAGDGRGPTAVVHVGDRQAVALFDGRRLLFGDGDGVEYLPLGAALDVVAHEYMHALLRAQLDLVPRGESAAVEEGLADVFACLIETEAGDRGNWTLGEAIRRPGPIRDLRDPRIGDPRALRAAWRSGPPPDQDALQAAGARIVGYAGYRLAQRSGGARAAAILYRAITVYLHQSPGLSDLADATLAAVQDLHGTGSAPHRDLASLWSEIGIDTVADEARQGPR